MDEQTFKNRTRSLGLRVIRIADSLPSRRSTDVIARQLVKCGTSIGANYRAACRARSAADMLSKLGVVEEEADETICWCEMAIDAGLISAKRVQSLIAECDEILSMVVASIRTLRRSASTRAASQSKIQNPKSKIVAS